MFRFLKNKHQVKVEKTECNKKSTTMVHSKSLAIKLIYTYNEFTFVKAVDVAVRLCGIKSIFLRSSINFSSKYTDISHIDGIIEGCPEIHTNILGIAGIDGTLPNCYVEDHILYSRESKKAVIDFFDIFNHKLLFLRYTYMKRLQIDSLSVPLYKSAIGNIMFSLSGFGFNELNNINNLSIPDQFKISCHNILWKSTRSSDGLRAILSSFFNIPVEINQFVGGFVKIDESFQTAIGTKKHKYNLLGNDSFLGNKVWNSMKGIEVVLGPLDIINYKKFIPKQSKLDRKESPLEKMKEIIKMYVPYGIEVKLKFILDQCFVNEIYLNGISRLNKDSFIHGLHKSKSIFFTEIITSK